LSLKYPADWKFRGVGSPMPPDAIDAFKDLLVDVGDRSKKTLEEFKGLFGGTGGSTSYDYAVHDLHDFLTRQSGNPAKFLDSFWNCIEFAEKKGLKTPTSGYINEILAKYDVPLRIQPPDLVLVDESSALIDAQIAADVEATTNALPGYRLGELIGRGGYGVVYAATRTTSVGEFEFAIKVLDPSPFIQNYDKAITRFEHEVAALRKLQHRAIVQYFEAGVTREKKPYVVLPLIDGRNLKAATEQMTTNDRLIAFVEILGGLGYAHAKGVLHRDLKPTNIIVRSSDSQPVILDFGSAYMLDDLDRKTLTSEAVGTAGYIPSEVLANPRTRSPLHDIYACGMMLYESFVGHRPDPQDYQPLKNAAVEYEPIDQIVVGAIQGASSRTKSADLFAEQLIRLLR
jgi:predicted Ser/Thr protein kinase